MYTYESRVRYTEIDEYGKMTIGSLINYLQDCSTFQSEDLGVGLTWLKDRNRAWLLTSWQILIERMPVFLEHITVGTHPYDFKGSFGMRNFVILDAEGQPLVKANSQWVLIDTASGRPVRVTNEDTAAYALEQPLLMPYSGRKIAVPEGGSRYEEFLVLPHHLDTNHHVNNSQYIQMAGRFLPDGFETGMMRAEYKRQAVLHDKVVPYVSEHDTGCVIVLEDIDRVPWAVVEFLRKK